MKLFKFAQEEEKLQILLTDFQIVLKSANTAEFLERILEYVKCFCDLKALLDIFVEDQKRIKSYIFFFELNNKFIAGHKGVKCVFFLQNLKDMWGYDKLITAKSFDDRACYFNNLNHIDEGLSFCEILLTDHDDVVDNIILDHEEGIVFQSQDIVIFYCI